MATPSYQVVADDLRSRISMGEYPVGSAIPSTAQLTKRYSVSTTVARHAVEQLRAEGVVEGHPGKAVFVKATPEDVAAERADAMALAEEIASLRAEVRGLARRDDLARVESNLIELYAKTGHNYPHEAAPADAAPPSRRAGGGRAVGRGRGA